MTDTFTPRKRSEIMSRISGKNTVPELTVRKILFSLGFRYRLHYGKLSGKPDIVVRRLRIAFFVNGCFWHQHKGCKRQSVPKSNIGYWTNKLKFNVEKQNADIKKLKKQRWRVFVVWECETKNKKELFDKLKGIYEKNNYI